MLDLLLQLLDECLIMSMLKLLANDYCSSLIFCKSLVPHILLLLDLLKHLYSCSLLEILFNDDMVPILNEMSTQINHHLPLHLHCHIVPWHTAHSSLTYLTHTMVSNVHKVLLPHITVVNPRPHLLLLTYVEQSMFLIIITSITQV